MNTTTNQYYDISYCALMDEWTLYTTCGRWIGVFSDADVAIGYAEALGYVRSEE